jgi:hypothetical protein
MVKIFKNEIQVGRYKIPADFKCLNVEFLTSLLPLDFFERVEKVYTFLSGKALPEFAFSNLLEVEFPASFCVLDDDFIAVELNDGNNLAYTDYIFSNADGVDEIYSFLSVITATYLSFVDSNVINFNEKVNFAIPNTDGIFALSCYVASKIGVPISKVVVAGENYKRKNFDNIVFVPANLEDAYEYLYYFNLDFDYVLDLESSKSLFAREEITSVNENGYTVIFSLISPYYDSRRVLQAITDEKELSVQKAINKLYNETAFEIPEKIENGDIKPFYKYRETPNFEYFIKIV